MGRNDKTAEGDAALREVVGALYEATLQPEMLPDALRGVANLTGAHMAVRGMVGTGGQNPSVAVSRGSSDWGHQLIGRAWDNAWTQGSLQHPFGKVMTTDDFLPFEQVRDTPLYHQVLRPLDIAHGIGCNWLADQTILLVTVFRSERQGRFSPGHLAAYRTLAPHMERAARVGLQLARARAAEQGALDVLHRLGPGLLIVDATARVRFASRSAERVLAAGGAPLQLRRGRLTAATAAQTRTLRQLVARAARTSGGVGASPGGTLLAGSPDAGSGCPLARSLARPLEVVVAPLAQVSLATLPLPAEPAALVMFRRTDDPAPSLGRLLQQLYGLTQAEARLAQAILAGQGLSRAAEALGIRRTTARTHLYRVFQKTRTRRQAELVRLLTSIPTLVAADGNEGA